MCRDRECGPLVSPERRLQGFPPCSLGVGTPAGRFLCVSAVLRLHILHDSNPEVALVLQVRKPRPREVSSLSKVP